MLSRSQLLKGPLLQVYLWAKYFTLFKVLKVQIKSRKRSDYVIDRKSMI